MKKWWQRLIVVVIAIAIVIDGYFLFFKNKLTMTRSDTGQTSSSESQSQSSSSTSSTTTSSTTYKDGTYTGKATTTKWGDVQVQTTIKNGKITAVNVLEYPNDNGHDKEINSQALPVYKAEAIKAQSAKIDSVSGASETYKGFTGSLQDALTQAED
ncbi:FMN-binding protein [Paucilactobacillus sp. N302-9]